MADWQQVNWFLAYWFDENQNQMMRTDLSES